MTVCRVCYHPDRNAIETDLISGKSLRNIAKCSGVSVSSLHRHKREHLPANLVAGVQARIARRDAHLTDQSNRALDAASTHAAALLDQLHSILARVTRLFDACDTYLADPDDPGRYDLSPRAAEILVRYTTIGPDGARRTHKATLAALLATVVESRADIAAIDSLQLKAADPRELLLKTAHRLETELQVIARLAGNLPDPAAPNAPATVNVLITSPEWLATRSAILRALEPYPDARLAVAAALRASATASGAANEEAR